MDFYAAVCKENGISSEVVTRFVPGIVAKMFLA